MNFRVTPGGSRAYTIVDMEGMLEAGILERDERLEPIAGEVVPMAAPRAAKGGRHEGVKGSIILLRGFGFALDESEDI